MLVKRIRLWINRNKDKVEEQPSHLEVHPNLETLTKYFDSGLFVGISKMIAVSSLNDAFMLCDRFGMKEHLHNIAFLIEALRQRENYLFAGTNHMEKVKAECPEYEGLETLIENVSHDRAKEDLELEHVSFSFKNQNEKSKTYKIAEPLSMQIVQSALREYFTTHKEEVKSELFEVTVTNSPNSSGASFETKSRLILPKEKFLYKTCNAIYNYLREKSPIKQYETKPSEDQCLFIAECLRCADFSQYPMEDYRLADKIRDYIRKANLQ